jgi:hypothetical protein
MPNGSGTAVLTWIHGNPATTPNDYLAPGFPGRSKVLANLYYNRYRDFDPRMGGIQADPCPNPSGQR